MATTAPLPSVAASGTIPDPMLREAVIKQMARKGLNLNQLAAASGVSYGRLHEWVNGKSASIRSDSLEAIMRAVGLKVSPIGRPPKPRR